MVLRTKLECRCSAGRVAKSQAKTGCLPNLLEAGPGVDAEVYCSRQRVARLQHLPSNFSGRPPRVDLVQPLDYLKSSDLATGPASAGFELYVSAAPYQSVHIISDRN
jgi:hypothetical protein